jgi:putative flippase GtrA
VTPQKLQTLIRFALVGALGFVVDASVLHVLVSYGGANLLLARACSFVCAATTTWAANRIFTFNAVPRLGRALLAEWAAYFMASLGGGCINYLVFAAAIRLSRTLHDFPTLAVGLGTLAGMIFNFAMYSRYVFRARPVS